MLTRPTDLGKHLLPCIRECVEGLEVTVEKCCCFVHCIAHSRFQSRSLSVHSAAKELFSNTAVTGKIRIKSSLQRTSLERLYWPFSNFVMLHLTRLKLRDPQPFDRPQDPSYPLTTTFVSCLSTTPFVPYTSTLPTHGSTNPSQDRHRWYGFPLLSSASSSQRRALAQSCA